MGRSITDILSWVDETIPNKLPTTSKMQYLSDLVGDGEFKKYNDYVTTYEFATSSGSAEYDLPAGVRVTDLLYVGISATTYNTTNVLKSTTPFTEYKYRGLDDEGVGYTEYTSQLALVPKPDNSYHIRIKYRPIYGPFTASSDTTTIITADSPLINYLQHKIAAKVCQAMSFPRIDLANNHEISAEENLATAKMNYFRKKRQLSKKNISYKGWW